MLPNVLAPLKPKWSEYIPKFNADGTVKKPSSKQIAFMMLPHLEALYGGAAGGGKFLRYGEVVLTPFGFKKCEDLRVGDRVNNPDGSISKIIQLKAWEKLPRWTVHFHDGTSTDVAEEHLWLSWRASKRKKKSGKVGFGVGSAEVITTRELEQQLLSGINPPLIPVCSPQTFNVCHRYPSSLDPYLLGVLLGDGCITGVNDVRVACDLKDFETHWKNILEPETYSVDVKNETSGAFRFVGRVRKEITAELEKLKLVGTNSHTKFIPRQYLLASIEHRTAILQGLMDTDGYVDSRGQLYYCSVSPQLRKDFCFLVRSLGGVAKEFDDYEVYVKLPLSIQPCRMKRKLKRWRDREPLLYKRVVKISKGKEIKGRCLTVSHPNGLYITNDFIVTHNSEVQLFDALQHVHVPNYAAIIFRRAITDAALSGAILDRALEWFSPFKEIKFHGNYNRFTFPSGATLTIGYLKNEEDHERYKSAEFQYIGFDEATDFSENQLRFLMTRLRRKVNIGVPLKIRFTTNPGGNSHLFLKKRFLIEKNEEGRWVGNHPHRPFIQAYLRDNPNVDQASYSYNLNQAGDLDKKRMKEGDWGASESARFKESDFRHTWQVKGAYFNSPTLGKSWHRNTVELFASVDPAASARDGVADLVFRANREPSYSVISVWGRTFDNYLLWLDQIRAQVEIPELLQRLIAVSKVYRPSKVIVDATGLGKGVAQMAEYLGLPICPVIASQDKVQNASAALYRASMGKIILPVQAAWKEVALGEILNWSGHPHETDDQVDALSNACVYVQDCVGMSEREYDAGLPSLPETIGNVWSNGLGINGPLYLE